MIEFDWSLVPGSVLCTVHLMLGLIVGYSTCYFAKPEQPPAHAPVADLQQFKSAMDGILAQAKQLSTLSQSHPAALPPAFLEAIAKLIESVNAFQSQARGRSVLLSTKAAAAPAIMRADPPEVAKPFSDKTEPIPFNGLATPLYDELTKTDGLIETEAGPRAVRRPYHVIQRMAPWNGFLPEPSDYQEIVCNDLSTGGLSFFTKEMPATKDVVVTLGQDHGLLMQAEIVHYQRRQHADSFSYYVGCRFIKRLENVPAELKPATLAATKSA